MSIVHRTHQLGEACNADCVRVGNGKSVPLTEDVEGKLIEVLRGLSALAEEDASEIIADVVERLARECTPVRYEIRQIRSRV